MKVTIVIPSLNPDHRLLEVVQGLIRKGFEHIVLVNDGSSPEHNAYFTEIAQFPQCTVLTHETNYGKGRALKTAFSHLLSEHSTDLFGVVTVDADNQHHPDDICLIAEALSLNPTAIILGTRDFSSAQVPLRSRFGNRLTSRLLHLVCGIGVSDTQTGLRAIPATLLPILVDLKGERFEYETNMLLASKRHQIAISELPVKTIYIDENASSHYRTLVDSFRILRVVLAFFTSSGISALIDIGLYWLLYTIAADFQLSSRILAATAVARIFSSAFNFWVNRQAVFMCHSKLKSSLFRYYLLAIVQMIISGFFVFILTSLLNGHSVLIKLLVDMILFFASFYIQRSWVFSHH